jgi:uncharacterized protein YndB with AHSA1/START domain
VSGPGRPDAQTSRPPEESAIEIHLTLRETIAAPPEAVYTALTEYERLPGWMLNVVRFERLGEGPLRPGSHWKQLRKRFGELATDDNEIVRMEPPHAVDVRVVSTRGEKVRAEYLFTFRLEAQGDGTLLTLTGDGEMTGVDYGPASEMVTHTVETLLAADLAGLKRYVEGGA